MISTAHCRASVKCMVYSADRSVSSCRIRRSVLCGAWSGWGHPAPATHWTGPNKDRQTSPAHRYHGLQRSSAGFGEFWQFRTAFCSISDCSATQAVTKPGHRLIALSQNLSVSASSRLESEAGRKWADLHRKSHLFTERRSVPSQLCLGENWGNIGSCTV